MRFLPRDGGAVVNAPGHFCATGREVPKGQGEAAYNTTTPEKTFPDLSVLRAQDFLVFPGFLA